VKRSRKELTDLQVFQDKWKLRTSQVLGLPNALSLIKDKPLTTMRTYLSNNDQYSKSVAKLLDHLVNMAHSELIQILPNQKHLDLTELCIFASESQEDCTYLTTAELVKYLAEVK